MTAPATSVEVFADVTCPFTHVGLRRLVERRRRLDRDDVHFRVRAWPLELVNGSPMCPTVLEPKIRRLRTDVAGDLFVGFDPTTFPPTSMPALMLAAHADDQSVELGERVNLLLRDALFEDGLDISDEHVLADIARRAGLSTMTGPRDREHVMADWRDGQQRGVAGSPHFFIEGASFFCPSLDITHVDGELQIGFDVEGFERFSRACFDA